MSEAKAVDTSATERLVGSYRRSARRRAVVVTGAIGAGVVALFALMIMWGSTYIPLGSVLDVLVGGSANAGVEFVVCEVRLPHAIAAVAVGLALGLSGSVFQQVLGNPLAAPDFVGISAGASLAAVVGIVLVPGGGLAVSSLALVGALASAGLIYVLAWRDGITGYRFILVGIGVSEFMLAAVYFVVARANFSEARQATHWLTGSIGQGGTREVWWLVAALVVVGPAVLVLDRQLRTLELGDDVARGLGVGVQRARLRLLFGAIVLTAFAAAVAGPIAFVALVAGPTARVLLGPTAATNVAAAGIGALIVMISDLVARQILPTDLPTGVVTGAIGAPYLLWLLVGANRKVG